MLRLQHTVNTRAEKNDYSNFLHFALQQSCVGLYVLHDDALFALGWVYV